MLRRRSPCPTSLQTRRKVHTTFRLATSSTSSSRTSGRWAHQAFSVTKLIKQWANHNALMPHALGIMMPLLPLWRSMGSRPNEVACSVLGMVAMQTVPGGWWSLNLCVVGCRTYLRNLMRIKFMNADFAESQLCQTWNHVYLKTHLDGQNQMLEPCMISVLTIWPSTKIPSRAEVSLPAWRSFILCSAFCLFRMSLKLKDCILAYLCLISVGRKFEKGLCRWVKLVFASQILAVRSGAWIHSPRALRSTLLSSYVMTSAMSFLHLGLKSGSLK